MRHRIVTVARAQGSVLRVAAWGIVVLAAACSEDASPGPAATTAGGAGTSGSAGEAGEAGSAGAAGQGGVGGSAGASGSAGDAGSPEVMGCSSAVRAGSVNVCAVDTAKALWCWGSNVNGTIGTDSLEFVEPLPVFNPTLGASVTDVSVGGSHVCAVKNDGTVWCWGKNDSGQLGKGAFSNKEPLPVKTALTGVAASVSTGSTHTCAVTSAGALYCWGKNLFGVLGDGTQTGDPCGIGDDPRCRATPVHVTAMGDTVRQVVAGHGHTCALKVDGSVWCWGENADGQLGDGTIDGEACGSTKCKPTPVQVTVLGAEVAQLSGTQDHSCAVKKDGTLWCWGPNFWGQVGNGALSEAEPTPVQVTALGTAVSQVSAGGGTTCAVKKDGTVWCWGANQYGTLGNGSLTGTICGSDTPCQASPAQVTVLGTEAVEVTVGVDVVCARKGSGSVWCWGQSTMIGDGLSTGETCGVSNCRATPVNTWQKCP